MVHALPKPPIWLPDSALNAVFGTEMAMPTLETVKMIVSMAKPGFSDTMPSSLGMTAGVHIDRTLKIVMLIRGSEGNERLM